MKRIVIILSCLFIFSSAAIAQLGKGFSIELGSGIWIPSEQDKAVALGLSVEPKYRFEYFGLGLQYQRGVLGFGIDEFSSSRNRANQPRPPFNITEASLKKLSSVHAILELFPFGFEDKIAVRLGIGRYKRGSVAKYDLIDLEDSNLEPVVKYGGCVGVLYNWNKTSAFVQLNTINKRGEDEGEGLTNYWSSGIVYHLKLKAKRKSNYKLEENRRLVFRVEFGPEVNIPVGEKAAAAAFGLFTDVKFYVKNKVYFGGSFSFSPRRRGHEESFKLFMLDFPNPANNNFGVISDDHILSRINSSSFIVGWIFKRKVSSFLAIGGGLTQFNSSEILFYANNTPHLILPEQKSLGAAFRLDYNLGYMSHSLTFNITPEEMPLYISYKTGIGLNFTKDKK